MDYRKILWNKEYDFLRDNPHLGVNLLFITLGGSHAYGTNVAGSDLDIRGCAFNTKDELLHQNCFEQVIDKETDTTIYGFNKLIKLLTNCNPNVIELLGLPPEYYFHITEMGEKLLDNRDMFLSKKAVQTFGGYAYAQLRRLDNKAVRTVSLDERQQHILNSMTNAQYVLNDKFITNCGEVVLRVDDAEVELKNGQTKEIFADVHLNNLPLRNFTNVLSELNSIQKIYDKNSKRNDYAANHGKLGKHMMHLIRLYLMCIDILRDGEIVTRRDKEHDLLMSIRNGKYLDDNNQPTNEFFEMVEHYQNEMRKAEEVSPLPPKPDMKRINDFQSMVNEYAIRIGKLRGLKYSCPVCKSIFIIE